METIINHNPENRFLETLRISNPRMPDLPLEVGASKLLGYVEEDSVTLQSPGFRGWGLGFTV